MFFNFSKVIAWEIDGLKERYYGDYSQSLTLSDDMPIDAESTDVFQKRVRGTLIEMLRAIRSDKRDLIVVSHQKVFEFLAEWLAHEKLKLEQGGVCYFEFNNGNYSAEIYRYSSPESSD